jgi:glycosyltransferase involved in cell wall biosynthesis
MRICFFTQNLYQLLGVSGPVAGGAETQHRLLALELRKRGIETCFIIFGCEQNQSLDSEFGTLFPIEKPRKRKLRGINLLTQLCRMLGAMRRSKADIFYLRGSGVSALVFFAVAWTRLWGKKFVFATSNDWVPDTKSVLYRRKFDGFLFKIGLKMCHYVLAQHSGQVELFKRNLGITSRVVQNCVEIPPIQETGEISEQERNKNLLFLGRITRVKRPDIFVQVAQRLPQYNFVLAGGFHEGEDLNYVYRVIEEAKRCKNIAILGNITPHEVQTVLKKAALLLATSEVEGFPNAFLEAWSWEVPVVSLVDPGGVMQRHGLLPPIGTLDKLVHIVDYLMRHPQERAMLGKASRRYVEKNHRVESVVDRLLSVIYDNEGNKGTRKNST